MEEQRGGGQGKPAGSRSLKDEVQSGKYPLIWDVRRRTLQDAVGKERQSRKREA